MQFFSQDVPSKEYVADGMNKMNSFGTRLTGSKGQLDFIAYLKDEIRAMGLDVYTDPYRFNRWEEKSSSLVLHTVNGDEDIHVSSAWPYSGETSENGVTGNLVYCPAKHVGFIGARNGIAVVKMKDFEKIPSTVAFNQRSVMTEDGSIPKYYRGPVATSFVKFPLFAAAKACGVRAMILIWEGMSDEMVEGQYLNFIMGYQGIPALWVNSTEGEKILKAAEKGERATLTLTAETEKQAHTESFYAIIPGEKDDKAVIINTHTDGTNCVEENGPVALLAMMKYFLKHKTDKTLIFVFVTGHFRLPNFKEGSMQATSKWLSSHRDLWDGKKGHIKAVAGVSVEHLGCKEYKDVNGKYTCTNDIDVELTYTGNKQMDEIYKKALEGRTLVRASTYAGHNFLHFGEGQPLFDFGIPEIALVTAPDYLCSVAENHHMDKFNIDLMYEQIETFIKCVLLIDETPEKQLGKPDMYSLVLGKMKTGA